MPTTLILVPDIYFRNWDESPTGTSGEMWLCLRPMIATGRKSDAHPFGDRFDDFLAWAKSPHDIWDGPAKRYEVKSPHELGLGMRVCDPSEIYLPINLPSKLDVQIRIGRRDALGQDLPEQVIDIKRTIGCKAVAGAQEGEDALGPYGAGALPFAELFNAKVEKQFVDLLGATPLDEGKIAQASFAFLQQMEAGRRIRFTPSQVRNAYATAETSRPVLEKNAAEGMVTTVFWFLGLMVRLGTQADLASLRRIDRVDIALRDTNPNDYGFIPFPDTQGGEESAYEYFQKVGKDFAHTLITELISHEKRVYVGPGFRGFQRVEPLVQDTTLWLMEGAGPQTGTTAERGAHGGLCRLAAIEMRGALAAGAAPSDGKPPPLPEIGNNLTVMPGLYVMGTLKRYRRFPDVAGAIGDLLRTTVLTFEPDPAMAAELAKLREKLKDVGLRGVFFADVPGWRLELLHAGVLPWDGPQPVYRMLAIPNAGAKATVPGSLMYPAKQAAFFIPALGSALPMEKVDRRHLWDPRTWKTITSAQALEDKWVAQAGTAWKDIRVNALQVRGITDAASASAHAMLLDEFDLSAAESPLRLEKVLGVTALSPRMAAIAAIENLNASDPRNFDPLRDYEDDFINLNTARVWRPNTASPTGETELDAALLRAPQRTEAAPEQCRVGGAQRRQTIPLLHGWASDPLDREDIASLDDNAAAQVIVGWQMVRDEVARRYNLLPEPDKGPYRIDLEHSYGDRYRVNSGTAPLCFERSARRGWPVALPTFVEAKDETGPAKPFLRCRFVPGTPRDLVELNFDLGFLTFPDMSALAARKDKRYALAVSAWRAIAEMASSDAVLKLHILPATFDVLSAYQRSGARDPAEVAAREGFAGGWASGIDRSTSIDIVGGTELGRVQTWARNLIAGGSGPGLFEVHLRPEDKPGASAHLVRVDLEIARKPDMAPVPDNGQQLMPISQQPGLFIVGADTMQGAWGRLGFGPELTTLGSASAGPVWPALQHAQKLWTDERSAYADSVTPEALPPLPAAPPAPAEDPHLEKRKARELQAALIAALDGSDWFAPAGSGPRTRKLAVEPVLVPVGFAPCRPHVTLKQQTQDALQRLMTALRDTIDLAYPDWTRLTAAAWRTRFDAIVALQREEVPATPTSARIPPGVLTVLAKLLIDRLLFAEPDGQDSGNAGKVRALVAALRDANGNPSGDLKWFGEAVRRRLLADPALFTDAKALLLTAVGFIDDPSGIDRPPATALARARFNRKGVGAPQSEDSAATTLTLDNLIFAGKQPGLAIEERLAFLETLDDARYGDSFEVPVTTTPDKPLDYVLDSYEELVDPRGETGAWAQRPAVLPLEAANKPGGSRVVHLASRALVIPPLLRWSGESDALAAALAGGAADWSIEQLEKGLPGSGATRLRLSASYSKPAVVATVERGSSFILYRVTGDEERPQAFEDAFANDSFFVRLSQSDYDRSPEPQAVIEDGGKLDAEPMLRALLFAGVGSDAAGDAIRDFALSGIDRSADLAQLIQPGEGQLPGLDYALIRLVRQTTGGWKLTVGGQPAPSPPDPSAFHAQFTLDTIRHAALFKPDGAASADGVRTAWLLIGFETSVWAPIDADVCHGRNVPRVRWTGQADAIESPRYAQQFWQSAVQDTPPSRHSLQRRARRNDPRHWKKRPTHVIKLDASWRLPKTPSELLNHLLFVDGHAVGDGQLLKTILSKASKDHIFDQQLSIQIAHEQFGEDPNPHAEPLGNFPLPENLMVARKPKPAPGAMRWFDPFYEQFSVSLRWFAPSGTSLLTLERIFVEF